MIGWLSPIGDWFGVNSDLVPFMLFVIIILLIIGIIRG